jgi:excinuclease ABC subunit A
MRRAAPASDRIMSELNACHTCGLSFGELTPASFSFNNPLGMCTDCNGLGTRAEMDPDRIVPDPSRTIRDGAVEPWASGMNKGEGWTADFVESLGNAFGIDLDVPYGKLPAKAKKLLMYGAEGKKFQVKWGEGGRYEMEWEGLVNKLMRSFSTTTSEAMRTYYQKFFSDKPCPTCEGARLKPESRAVKVHKQSIVDLSRMTIGDALQWLSGMELTQTERKIATELLKEIRSRLTFLEDVGLAYLTLDRTASTLSGGESQRIRLASQMGSELTGVIYILDEPSIGLHQRDNGKLLTTLKRLRDLGNSVIVVEHDEETMEEADWIVDFGPGAGELGGQVVAQGTPSQVMADENSVTGAYLSGRKEIEVPDRRHPPRKEKIVIRGAKENNLKDVDVEIPLGVLVAVTGVSGAGKSTLINEILYPALARQLYESREVPGRHKAIHGLEHLDKVIDIDQRPSAHAAQQPGHVHEGVRRRREVFALTQEARAFGYTSGRFSSTSRAGAARRARAMA